jgi:hypothetical protein
VSASHFSVAHNLLFCREKLPQTFRVYEVAWCYGQIERDEIVTIGDLAIAASDGFLQLGAVTIAVVMYTSFPRPETRFTRLCQDSPRFYSLTQNIVVTKLPNPLSIAVG